MAIIQVDDIADLLATTQRDLGKLNWTDISTNLQQFVALPQLLDKNKVGFDGGTGTQWNVMVQNSGAARMTGLFQVDDVNVADVMKQAYAPWRHVTTNWAVERREVNINSSPWRIVDLVKVRRADAMVSLAELYETQFWGAAASATDSNIWGCGVYVVYDNSATAGVGAFTSSLATGFSDVAGLSPTTYTRWRNWSGKYATIDTTNASTNLVTMMREAAYKTGFMSLPAAGIPQYGGNSQQKGYYTNYNVIKSLEWVLTQQNDNLGNDVASRDGKVLFRGTPVTWVPYLDLCNQDPVYGLDWNTFQPCFLEGEYMYETQVKPVANQHTTYASHIDCSTNIRCTDRRKQFVLSNSASAISYTSL